MKKIMTNGPFKKVSPSIAKLPTLEPLRHTLISIECVPPLSTNLPVVRIKAYAKRSKTESKSFSSPTKPIQHVAPKAPKSRRDRRAEASARVYLWQFRFSDDTVELYCTEHKYIGIEMTCRPPVPLTMRQLVRGSPGDHVTHYCAACQDSCLCAEEASPVILESVLSHYECLCEKRIEGWYQACQSETMPWSSISRPETDFADGRAAGNDMNIHVGVSVL